MAFESIPEQESAARWLRGALGSGRLPHAYLFAGSAGTGRLAAAHDLARILLCNASKRPDSYCGQCPNCKLFEAGSHPDYSETGVPEGRQLLPIEAVRRIQGAAALKPVRAARRVFVIREADRMSLDAANCFLKTLEEPPGNCLFILIASSLRLIPETIVSRCRIVRFVNLSPQRLQSRLEAEGMEARDAHWLARRAWGSPGLAERFQQMGLHDFNRQLVEKLGQLSAADSLAFSDWLNDAARAAHSGAETRIRLQELLECAALYYRDLALAATAGGSECELCNQAAKDAMKEQAAATSPEAFLDKADLVLETIERIGANAHSRLALDRLFTRLPRPARAPT